MEKQRKVEKKLVDIIIVLQWRDNYNYYTSYIFEFGTSKINIVIDMENKL